VARRLPGIELVSVDSMQVYVGMEVGTAKPSAAERAEVPHHLLDLADPSEQFAVTRFQAAAEEAIGGIEARGHRALLVGGTGLYLQAVVDGLRLPGQWPDVRAALEAELEADGAEREPSAAGARHTGHQRPADTDPDPVATACVEPGDIRRLGPAAVGARLQRPVDTDPVAAAHVVPGDARRIVGAAAVDARYQRPADTDPDSVAAVRVEAGGAVRIVGPAAVEAMHRRLAEADPVAAARIEPGNARRIVRALEVTLGSGRPFSSFGPGLDAYPRSTRFRLAGVWLPREVLNRRIEERYAAQLEAGFIDEVRALPEGLSRTARQALGYRELLDHLDGESTLAEAVDEAVRRTKAFARRQRSWFRRDPRITWLGTSSKPLDLVPALLGDWARA
jgi:tRNA A37 N6-isopentenylltransferase MiaA